MPNRRICPWPLAAIVLVASFVTAAAARTPELGKLSIDDLMNGGMTDDLFDDSHREIIGAEAVTTFPVNGSIYGKVTWHGR